MNLLQTVADTLIREGLANNYSEFSQVYCGLTPNFYYRQKHFSRGYSLEALINTCIKLRKVNCHYDKYATVFESEQTVLTRLENLIKEELLSKYRIKELMM
jgi:hypothetical protein